MELPEVRDAKSLIKFLEERTDYKEHGNYMDIGQLSNGAHIHVLLNFLDDNPGAIDGITEFMEREGMIPDPDDDEYGEN